MRARARDWIADTVAPPDGVAAAVEPLQWFLTTIGDGIPLTQTGNPARSFVVAAATERGWATDRASPPRSADDVPELVILHALARAIHAARHHGRSLRLVEP